MGVGRGRVAGATIAAPSIGINTATATGSTAADIFMAAGSSTGSSTDRSIAADISAAAGSSTGPGAVPGTPGPTGAGDPADVGSSGTDNSDSADALSPVADCARLGAVIVANKGLCLGHQRLYDAQPSLDPRRSMLDCVSL